MTKPRTLQDIRKAELSQIHIAKKQLGWDDDTYRAAIRAASKGATDSSADLDYKQRKLLLDRMKASGFKVRPARKPTKTRDIPINDDRDQVKKIRSQWLDLHEFGAVRDSSERAMCAYIARVAKITDGKEHPKFLTLEQASDVIETLKKWQQRTRLTPFLPYYAIPSHAKLAQGNTVRVLANTIHRDTEINPLECDKAQWLIAIEKVKTLLAQKRAANTGNTGG